MQKTHVVVDADLTNIEVLLSFRSSWEIPESVYDFRSHYDVMFCHAAAENYGKCSFASWLIVC